MKNRQTERQLDKERAGAGTARKKKNNECGIQEIKELQKKNTI